MEECVKEQTYLFVFEDNSVYKMSCGISFKDAVYEMVKYIGNNSETFRKLIFSDAFGENDVDDIVKLFNHWCIYKLKTVYVMKEKLYE